MSTALTVFLVPAGFFLVYGRAAREEAAGDQADREVGVAQWKPGLGEARICHGMSLLNG